MSFLFVIKKRTKKKRRTKTVWGKCASGFHEPLTLCFPLGGFDMQLAPVNSCLWVRRQCFISTKYLDSFLYISQYRQYYWKLTYFLKQPRTASLGQCCQRAWFDSSLLTGESKKATIQIYRQEPKVELANILFHSTMHLLVQSMILA